jgi:hypothetical protein
MSPLLVADPSIGGPKLHFGNQLVANNAPDVFFNTPGVIPGAVNDAWNIIEWSQQQVIDPSAVTVNAPSTYDASLGINAAYSWSTPDGETAVKVYDTAAYGWIYDLAGAGTTADTNEHDVFLETAQNLTVNMGGNEVDYSMNAKIVSEGNDPTQPKNAAVYAAAVTGFTFNYNLPGQPDYSASQPTFSVFLQIPLSSTHNDSSLLSYFSWTTNSAGQPTSVITDQLRSENALLPTSGSSTTHETYNLTAYVADLASYLQIQKGLGFGVTDLARWTATGVYTGIITQGAVAHVDLQVSNIQLTRADTPSTAALQINLSPITITAPPSAGSGGTASAYKVSDDGLGQMQVTSPGSAAPQLTQSAAGAFTLPDGEHGYFDPDGTGEDVARLFQAALGRHPDAGTISIFVAIDGAGLGLTTVAQDFLTSAEYQAKYAGESNAAFVSHVYQDALGRAPGNGPNYWTSLLDGGISKAAVLIGIGTSAEAISHSGAWDGSDVYGGDYRAFETVLGRAPDQSSQSWLASMVGGGMTSQGVISTLMDSSEMLTRYVGQTPTAIVGNLYQNGLGRAADPGGLANAVSFLGSGGSVVSLAYGIANSPEARNVFASVTHANWVSTPA